MLVLILKKHYIKQEEFIAWAIKITKKARVISCVKNPKLRDSFSFAIIKKKQEETQETISLFKETDNKWNNKTYFLFSYFYFILMFFLQDVPFGYFLLHFCFMGNWRGNE